MFKAAQIFLSSPAVSIAILRDSITHVPAIKKNGLSIPISNPHKFIYLTSYKIVDSFKKIE
jgi:hypothetical protein